MKLYYQGTKKPDVTEALSTNIHTSDKMNVDIKYPFVIFHQNIQGLKNKVNELLLSIYHIKP
jgi:hypothetical protein